MPLLGPEVEALVTSVDALTDAVQVRRAELDAAAAGNAVAIDSVQSLQRIYLGAANTDPILDNTGQPLQIGALYYDTVNDVLKVYDTPGWRTATGIIQGVKQVFRYTATSGQTVFTGNDLDGRPLVIDDANLLSVFRNGIRLVFPTQYSVNISTETVTLSSGATAGDSIVIEILGNYQASSSASMTITGGTIDNTVIGGTTPAAGSFTIGAFGAGSATTPSITRTGDTNTGMYFPSADTIAISTNGSHRLTIGSTGGIGINTTTPEASAGWGILTMDGVSGSEITFRRFGVDVGQIGTSGIANNLLIDGLSTASVVIRTAVTDRITIDSSGQIGVGTAPIPSAIMVLGGTTRGFRAPSLTTTQRDAISSPVAGLLIYNSTVNSYQAFNGSTWTSVGGGATGGGSNQIFWENDQTISVNYTLTAGKNAMTAGPVTINNGISVTVGNGQSWTIV